VTLGIVVPTVVHAPDVGAFAIAFTGVTSPVVVVVLLLEPGTVAAFVKYIFRLVAPGAEQYVSVLVAYRNPPPP
jgi:hypothetical protein